MVFATCVPAKAPRIFKTAPNATALRGDKAFVETTVAMAFAASCMPLIYSKMRVVMITIMSSVRPMSGVLYDDVKNRIRYGKTGIHGALNITINTAVFYDFKGI